MSIYLTLSPDLSYSNNTLGEFSCNICPPLEFKSKYEVALTEFIYFNNVSISHGSIEFEYPAYMNLEPVTVFDSFNLEKKAASEASSMLSSRIQHSITSFIGKINNYQSLKPELAINQALAELTFERQKLTDICISLSDLVKKYSLFFNEIRNLLDSTIESLVNVINLYKNSVQRDDDAAAIANIFTNLSESVAKLDEFQNQGVKRLTLPFVAGDDSFFKKNFFYSDKSIRPYIKLVTATDYFNQIVFGRIQQLRIHTNIIRNSTVSNKPVLKIVKLNKNDNELVEKSFNRPEYLPVNQTFINRIYFEIKDQFDNAIHFGQTPVILILHFRPVK